MNLFHKEKTFVVLLVFGLIILGCSRENQIDDGSVDTDSDTDPDTDSDSDIDSDTDTDTDTGSDTDTGPAPEGDDCTEPILFEIPGILEGDTTGASDNYIGNEGDDAYGPSPERVYTFTTTEFANWTFEITYASFTDTVIFLRSVCEDAGSEVAFDDDSGEESLSMFSIGLDAGTYYLFVEGYYYDPNYGEFSLTVTQV